MAIQSDQSFFACVLEDMKEGILVIGPKGMVLYSNEQAGKMLNLHPGESGSILNQIQQNPKNDVFADYILDAVYKKELHQQENVEYVNPSGKKYCFQLTTSYLKNVGDAKGNIIVTLSDITELETIRQKSRDHVVIQTLLMSVLCLWNLVYSAWNELGQPLSSSTLTKGVEIIGIVVLLFTIKTTSLSIKDMGIRFENIKAVMKRSAIISASIAVIMIIAKVILLKVAPGVFPEGAPFFDFRRIRIQFILYIYTAFIQEFISRGVIQESLANVFQGKHSHILSIAITSLLFAALHIHKGLLMCIGAGVLSILLGILYRKDRTIWGLVLVHYTFGLIPNLLGISS